MEEGGRETERGGRGREREREGEREREREGKEGMDVGGRREEWREKLVKELFVLLISSSSSSMFVFIQQVAGGSHAREVSYANFKAFNQFLGNLDIMERIVRSVTKSDPTTKVTQGEL